MRKAPTIVSFVLFVGLIFLAGATFFASPRSFFFSPARQANSTGTYGLLDGEIEYVWQLPPRTARGVLFVAHGCNHGAIDFFDKSESCPTCIGLPEEKVVAQTALRLGLAVCAVSSVDRLGSRCWDNKLNAKDSRDVQRVKRVLKAMSSILQLDKLPLYAFGASSGGAFVSHLPHALPIKGVIIQIMGAHTNSIFDHGFPNMAPYPPAVFMHMTRDHHTAALVEMNAKYLQHKSRPVKVKEYGPLAIDPSFFANRIAEIDLNVSVAIHDALKSEGYLDADNFLRDDPRRSEWRSALRNSKKPELTTLPLEPEESALSEEMNLAFAVHEIISSGVGEALEWIMSSSHS